MMGSPSLLVALGAVLKRDLRLAIRHRAELANPVLFYVIVISLFPFGVGSDPVQLKAIAPGIIWVAALLATLLALEGLFRSDFEDGSLEQLLLGAQPVAVLVLGKVFVHWCTTGVPLLVITPVLALLLNMDTATQATLLLALLIGTPTLSLIGAIGMALTVGIKRSGVLLTLLVLPLYVSVLIFGAGVVLAAQAGLPTAGWFYALAAMFMLALALAPVAASAALRVSLN